MLADVTPLADRWGADNSQEEIVLNGQIKTIRKNLAEVIRGIRNPNAILPVWIDALSINQDDLLERSREVRRMGDIYDIATSVFCWVGAESDDTKDAFNFMKELIKHPVIRINVAGEFHFGKWGTVDEGISKGLPWWGENTIRPDKLAKLCAALYKFMTRQYFRRSWILQVCYPWRATMHNTDLYPGSGTRIKSCGLCGTCPVHKF
jgi:hypothetical protein